MKEEDQRKQSEQSSDQVKFVNVTTRVDSDYCFFFQENKSYDVKRPFALILCLPVAVPSVYLSRTSHCEQLHMYVCTMEGGKPCHKLAWFVKIYLYTPQTIQGLVQVPVYSRSSLRSSSRLGWDFGSSSLGSTRTTSRECSLLRHLTILPGEQLFIKRS